MHEILTVAAAAGEMAKESATSGVKNELIRVDRGNEPEPVSIETESINTEAGTTWSAPEPIFGPNQMRIFSDKERVMRNGLRDDGITLTVRSFTITETGGLEVTIDPEEQRRWADRLIRAYGLSFALAERPEYSW